MGDKLSYERTRARKEVEHKLRAARQMKEESEPLTMMLFIGCAISGKEPGEMAELWRSCRAQALLETADDPA